MTDKKLILNKLKEYKNFTTDKDFANFLSISSANLSAWYKRNTFDENKIVELFPEVSRVWILTGEGDMLKNSQKIGDITGSNNTAVAGNGNHVNSETDKFLDLLKTQNEMLQKRDTQIDELIALLKK